MPHAAQTFGLNRLPPCSPFQSFAAVFQKQATVYGKKPYLIYRDGPVREVFTYEDFFKECCQLAHFMASLGLCAGARIGTVAFNHPQTVKVTYAAWLLGVAVVPFNMAEADERLIFSFNDAGVKAIFFVPEEEARLKKLKPELKTSAHFFSLQEATDLSKKAATTCPEVTITQETEALVVYTSGTTGQPKGVLLCQGQLLADAHFIAMHFNLGTASTAMNVLPIHHVNGLVVTLLTPLYSGGQMVLNRRFSASSYWRHAQEEGVTWGSVVPTVLSFLVEAQKHFVPVPQFTFLLCGAGPLTTQTLLQFEKTFPLKVIHGYGLSETTCFSSIMPLDLKGAARQKWLDGFGYPSIGAPLPCNEMAIHSPEGQALSKGERGEIVIRGSNVMEAYFRRPEANQEAFLYGWFRSGDEGFFEVNENGQLFFFITGRLKELIIRGGVNYSPLEIDEVLARIDGVKAAMAVGFEHDLYGEEVGAYVQLQEGVTLCEEDILKACQSLPFPKRPKVVVFGEEFPVTATGKYQRLKLKPLFKKWQSVQFKK